MYIAKIEIENFRNFKKTEIVFNDGVNVIIGPNNTGKTNLIKALSLPIDYRGNKRLDVDDFNKDFSIEEIIKDPPKIKIAVTLKPGSNEEVDDLVTVSNWLTKLDASYEAILTYEYFLPEKELEVYRLAMCDVEDVEDETMKEKAWRIIKHDFLRLYIYRVWGGHVENQNIADGESLQKFDFQFLSAIRDVERDMLTGRNTLLRDVLDFFMDYDIKVRQGVENETKHAEIKQKKIEFSELADELLQKLQLRMESGKKQILSYAKSTGALISRAKPDFDGSVSDVEMFSTLRLIVEYETGIKIPATHNGLGYNNLIFMSLLLAKMQVDSDGNYLGSNAKVFSTLAIEEPEAHLHPSMQYKFLRFLKENKDEKKVRQVFVTTHSTHITSAISLDEIICLYSKDYQTEVGYPGRVFEDEKSRNYVQRFLDATKSDMLFAQKIILVEGLAEQILVPIFAKYLGRSLEDYHIAVINVGGRYFKHFLKMFDNSDSSLPKKVACLTDRDPERKKRDSDERYSACFPFQIGTNDAEYDYKDNASGEITAYENHSNIRFFSQCPSKGKTFEYDLILHNPTSDLLLTDTMKNLEEIKELMRLYESSKTLDEILDCLPGTDEKPHKKNQEIKDGVKQCDWSDDNKKIAVIASRYLNSISKGENALQIAYALDQNWDELEMQGMQDFRVPKYISDAIDWICQ